MCPERKEDMSSVPYLRLISGGHSLTIKACSGKRTIAKAKMVFRGHIDPDFVGYGLDVEGVATPDMGVEVHELVSDGQFENIYNNVERDLEKLVLTQDQVISFVEDHLEGLRKDNSETFFLLKKGKDFFVARVSSPDGELLVLTYWLKSTIVWDSDDKLHFVFPQLTPASVVEEVAISK